MVPARFVDFTKPVPESWQILDISMKYGTMIGIVVAFETTIPITNQVWGTHVSGGLSAGGCSTASGQPVRKGRVYGAAMLSNRVKRHERHDSSGVLILSKA